MRQFTSPVVVSSIQGEDTFPALSQRTSSSGAASLACLPRDATAVQSPIQKHCRECLFRSFSLCMGPCCFRPLVKACSVHSGGFIVLVDGVKTGSDKSCFCEKAMQLQKWAAWQIFATSDCLLWGMHTWKNLMCSVDRIILSIIHKWNITDLSVPSVPSTASHVKDYSSVITLQLLTSAMLIYFVSCLLSSQGFNGRSTVFLYGPKHTYISVITTM